MAHAALGYFNRKQGDTRVRKRKKLSVKGILATYNAWITSANETNAMTNSVDWELGSHQTPRVSRKGDTGRTWKNCYTKQWQRFWSYALLLLTRDRAEI